MFKQYECVDGSSVEAKNPEMCRSLLLVSHRHDKSIATAICLLLSSGKCELRHRTTDGLGANASTCQYAVCVCEKKAPVNSRIVA